MPLADIELRLPRLTNLRIVTPVFVPILASFLLSETAQGAGYYLPNQDALATAKGNAFIATADSAAAVHYNPAGLTQLQHPEAIFGLYSIQLGNEARIDGESYTPKSEWQTVPHAYYAHPVTDRMTLGFGLAVPFGLGNDWGQRTPFRTITTKGYLKHPSATVAVGYKTNDRLSLGGSISLNYVDLELEQGLGLTPGDYLRFEGDGISVSGAVSVRWTPRLEHAFGFVVGTGTSPELDGDIYSNVIPESSAKFEFFTPMRIGVGYSFRPTARWNIEANIEWLGWDALNTLDLKAPTLPSSGSVPVVFNWQSNLIYELGFTYSADGGYILAAGYDYNENAQPDETFQPSVADADRHWFNAGIGKRSGDSMWFLTYQLGHSNRTVRNNPENAAGQTANGRYSSQNHAVVFSWRQSFR